MSQGDLQQLRPTWVKIALLGLPNRTSAWTFVWVSLGVAAVSVAYGFVDTRSFAGAIMLLAAWWYYASLRWVDRHGRWS